MQLRNLEYCIVVIWKKAILVFLKHEVGWWWTSHKPFLEQSLSVSIVILFALSSLLHFTCIWSFENRVSAEAWWGSVVWSVCIGGSNRLCLIPFSWYISAINSFWCYDCIFMLIGKIRLVLFLIKLLGHVLCPQRPILTNDKHFWHLYAFCPTPSYYSW